MRTLLNALLLLAAVASATAVGAAPAATLPAPSKVSIDPDGVTVVNGKRFFPIGIYAYELNSLVMADLHEHRFNTVIGNGFKPDQLDFLHEHGMMAVPFSTPEFIAAGVAHPALLAWYLVDEPEGHDHTPASVKKAYDDLKTKDANHPIGLCHYLFDAAATFKGCSDFTMTDVYPITANRDVPLANVGIHMDEVRRVNGTDWPNWTYIQCFGGPETDGGKWANPLPHEVRCMTFEALVHRAQGILYFSYWPRLPQTWASITELNRDLERIVPWLIAKEGKEVRAGSSEANVHLRARQVGSGWLIIAVNVGKTPCDATLAIAGLGDAELELPYEHRKKRATGGKLTERFGPFEAKVYLAGPEPRFP
ncbi:MAG: hypothetical protein ABIP55_15140 [Tepidisphaeraceae bacterium]